MVLRSLRTSWAKSPLIQKVAFSPCLWPCIGDFLFIYHLIVPSIMHHPTTHFWSNSLLQVALHQRSDLFLIGFLRRKKVDWVSTPILKWSTRSLSELFVCLFVFMIFKNVFHIAGFHNIWINHIDTNANIIDHRLTKNVNHIHNKNQAVKTRRHYGELGGDGLPSWGGNPSAQVDWVLRNLFVLVFTCHFLLSVLLCLLAWCE